MTGSANCDKVSKGKRDSCGAKLIGCSRFQVVGCRFADLISVHPETAFMGVILRSKATKNLVVAGSAEILRFAQNDMEGFPDGH